MDSDTVYYILCCSVLEYLVVYCLLTNPSANSY